MKKIVIIGASGFVGSAILQEAIHRDYMVNALVQNPEMINLLSENRSKVKADV